MMALSGTVRRSVGGILRSAYQLRSQQQFSHRVIRAYSRPSRLRSKFGFGTFLTSSVIAARGFSLWSSPAQPEMAEPAAPSKEELVTEEAEMAEPAAPSKEELVIEEADKLYHSYEFLALYEHLIKFKDSNNVEILWRLARATRDVSNMESTSKDDKKRLTYEALEYMKRALDLDQSHYACHKWYAICLSDVGDYEAVKKKISNAYIIKEHFEKAIELNPNDATSVHLLGLWCFTFADMPWYQAKIAAMVFGTPPTSSYGEALEHFLKAEEINPNFYSKNFLMIGKTYKQMGNTKMALLYLTKARDAPARKEEERQTKKDAIALLEALGVKS